MKNLSALYALKMQMIVTVTVKRYAVYRFARAFGYLLAHLLFLDKLSHKTIYCALTDACTLFVKSGTYLEWCKIFRCSFLRNLLKAFFVLYDILPYKLQIENYSQILYKKTRSLSIGGKCFLTKKMMRGIIYLRM